MKSRSQLHPGYAEPPQYCYITVNDCSAAWGSKNIFHTVRFQVRSLFNSPVLVSTYATEMVANTVNTYVNFLATTNGRDKVYRFVQYFARFYSWYLLRQNSKDAYLAVEKLKAHLGLARRRKPIEMVQGIANSYSVKDTVLRICNIGKCGANGLYFIYDMLCWIDSVGLYKFKNIKKYNDHSNRYWLYAIVFSWLAGLYRLRQLYLEYGVLKRVQAVKTEAGGSTANNKLQLANLSTIKNGVLYQFVIDSLDMIIPLAGLNYIHLNEGVVGTVGAITSFMGGVSQWEKSASK
ncbi:PEX11-domain-containing protein [Basidiobolus meristosporus CBS 931.73]|uniref:PEX11-domain-containing protein n=1 Tax=Basidiobolus meristosporus CBS 931.73 TaxID=1314790 RepID=A0A1Y1XUJ2_9FUNG|nr:PEX11-domain-containing protein [Basidiobolus meristosporus CBS 931.73]|eukprot:ORX89418.1 PEX11-domain-containing protein [Basidiobolus meristosporus CBS 931.73]